MTVASYDLQKFQELKTRREKECDKPAEKRKAALKNKALKAGKGFEDLP